VLLAERDLAMGFIIKMVLSPNTGIERTQPLSIKERLIDFSPTQDKTFSAMTMAPPVFSRKVPRITPNKISNPTLPITPPKPSVMDCKIILRSMPTSKPYPMAPPKSARKGWIS
jgi:hypothetical protein